MSGNNMSVGRAASKIYIGTSVNNTEMYSDYTLITGAYGNSIYNPSLVTISTKNSYRSDGLTIQTKMDGNWMISFLSTDAQKIKGQITGGYDYVNYQSNSDRRLKKNIQSMEPMLEKIMTIKPCSYQWISSDEIGYGFIAQEVHEIFPQLKSKHPSCEESCDVNPCDCSGNPVYYGLDYGKFTPYIVKAVQEMKTGYDAKLQEQSEQIAQLMARVAALESS